MAVLVSVAMLLLLFARLPAQITATGDSDRDGCSDVQESQTAEGSEGFGGRRNPNNFWDFFDTPDEENARDRSVNTFDILRVAARFGARDAGGTAPINRNTDPLSVPPPAPAYHPAFDRGPHGPNPWDLGPPDGTIRVADILAAVRQFGHDCPVS